MRTSSPDDDFGAVLFTSLPSIATHQIDAFSPVLPPFLRGGEQGTVIGDYFIKRHGLELREADSFTGNRDGLQCKACGETYATAVNLRRHIGYCRILEKADGIPKSAGGGQQHVAKL